MESPVQEKSQIVITGGGGYLGYHIAVLLKEAGFHVILYDLRPPLNIWESNGDFFCKKMKLFVQELKEFRIREMKRHQSDIEVENIEEEEEEEEEKEENESEIEEVGDGKEKSDCKGSITFVRGDICDSKGLSDCILKNVFLVVHTASYGMSATENLPAFDDITEKVNLEGSRNVLRACLKSGVRALIYTSTVNVVYKGNEVIDGMESELPYLSLSEHTDHYSRTKQVAEEIILTASGRRNKRGDIFRSAALRLVGLYGPMEQRHLPRTIEAIRKGYMKALYAMETKQDLLHIENAVQAHCKAMIGILSDATSNEIGGEAFSITDGHPVNNLKFFLEPLLPTITGTSDFPTLMVPLVVLIVLGFILNFISRIFGKRFKLPIWALTLTEVYKTGVYHTFSIEKARRGFGYDPVPITKEHWQHIIQSYDLAAKN